MKSKPEFIEGPEAWDRLRKATEAILTVKKTYMPPSPSGKKRTKKAK